MSDEMTDREREIIETLIEFEQKYGHPASCGTIGGMLGYRATAECHQGRIAAGVMGRMKKRGLVERGYTDDMMTTTYSPTDKAREELTDD